MEWLEEAAGTKALVNQTHTRLGLAKPKGESDLGIRGFVKGRGEFGPWLIRRMYNEHGEPFGYNRVMGSDLLKVADQNLLGQIPVGEPLTFGEVAAIVGHDPTNRKPTAAFLKRCEDAKVIVATGKKQTTSRRYTRAAEGAESCHS